MAAPTPASESTLSKLTAQLQDQNSKLDSLVGQGEAQIEAAEDAARSAAEAAREAARKGDEEPPEIAIKLETEEDDGWFSGVTGTIVAAISGAVAGSIAGLSIGFVNMWTKIFKFLGGKFTTMFPDFAKGFGEIFGKEGKIVKVIRSIKAFFTESKAFKVMEDLIAKGKATITKVMKPIKATFTSMKTGFTTFITKIKSWIKLIVDPIDDIKKLLGLGGKAGTAGSGVAGFGKTFGKFFTAFKGFFSKIFLPLQVIISLVEGFFEAKDAVDKSEGMMATFFNAIVGFFGGILDGLIFGMLDLIKDGISWIAGFLGFEDVEKFLDSFSFSDMFNEFLDDIYKWFNLLFSDPVAALTNLLKGFFGAHLAIGDFIVDMLKKPFIWIMELFGWDDAAAATESFSLSGTVMAAWDKVVAWVKGLFAWGKAAGATEEGGWSFMTFIESAWTKVKEWFASLLSWGKEQPGVSWIMSTIDTVVTTVKGWFTGLFSWASEEDESDSWVVKTIKGIVTSVKEWFGSMFQFDSASGLLKTVLNLMMWIPNLFVKAVAGITAWFAGLLGFEKESKEIAAAGKDFSFGDLIFKAVKAIGDYFSDLFDSIVNFDFGSLAKSIMPGKLYDWIFGDGKEVAVTEKEEAKVKQAEEKFDEGQSKKSRKELVSMGLLDEDALSKDNLEIGKIQAMLLATKDDKAQQAKLISALTLQLGDTDIAEDERQQLAAVLELTKGVKLKGKAEGGLVGLSPFATGTLGAAMGLESGGLFTLTQGEMVLDNQAAQTFLQAAMILKGQDLSSGQNLMDLQRDKATAGGMAATMIVNNTNSQQNIQSQAMVLPPSPIVPGNGGSTLAGT